MKLKGLAKAIKDVEALGDTISEKIDDLDQDGSQWDEKDTFLNDAWSDIDEAKEALERVREMTLEAYL